MAELLRWAGIVRVQISGSDSFCREPALAVIGTWDPMLDPHRELFRRLAVKGAAARLTPVVIVLHPSPVRFLNPGDGVCCEYSDLHARIALIRECAPVKVLTVRMTRRDLDASVQSLLGLLKPYIRLKELWLGAHQSLGRCKQGSAAAIASLARRRNITLRRLPPCDACRLGSATLQLIGKGKLRSAARRASGPPIWRRPQSGVLRLDWPEGAYLATPMSEPRCGNAKTPEPISVRLVRGKTSRTLIWPSKDIKWLSFLAGPAD